MADTDRIDLLGLRSAAAKSDRGLWFSPAPANPNQRLVLSFDSGVPDPDLFPVNDFLAATEAAFRQDARGAVQYGNLTHGFEGLRDLLAERARQEDGKVIERDNVMLTSGSAQAISLTLAAFLDPGDAVIVEAPTWGYVLRDIQLAGAKTVAVSMDADGMLMDELEETLRRLRRDGTRTKLVYTISNFNNPMGVCLSLERRKKLLRLAQEWGFIILDDDTYGDLRYDGENIPSLYGLDESGLVLKAKTFSKTIGPALRMGWVLGDRRALAALASVRRDLGMSQIIARSLAEYIKAGKFEPHVARVSAIYRSKRDAMRAYLGEYCAPFIKWNNPAGGFYLWLELSPQVDPVKLTQLAAAKGVYCRPGQSTFPDDRGKRNLRAAFSSAPMSDIELGVKLLGEALAASAS